MSQPVKRYDVGMETTTHNTSGMSSSFPWVYPCELGKYVLHSDYAALAAENERLRKAGDELCKNLDFSYSESVRDSIKAENDWHAAKEGRDAK